jgi:cytochrome c553
LRAGDRDSPFPFNRVEQATVRRIPKNARCRPRCAEIVVARSPIVSAGRERFALLDPKIRSDLNPKMNLPRAFVLLPLALTALAMYGADAAQNWADKCAKCHGADGKGDTKMGRKLSIKDYTQAAVQAEFTDADALKALKEGRKDKGGKMLMQPVEGLSDEEMQALVAHVRGLKK